MAKHKVYTFYAELKDYKPKIWRRFEINGEKTVAELSYAIMIMFEMQASHLFALTTLENSKYEKRESVRYAFNYDDIIEDDEEVVYPDEEKVRFACVPGDKYLFEYDYGDGWEVSLVLENVREEEISLSLLPRVLEGKRYGIVEDVGGVYGLKNLAKVLKKGKGEEYEELTDWLGSTTLDLETFDKEDINFRLKKILRIYRDIYEYEYGPTAASIKLLNRAYLGKGYRGY